MCKHNVKHQDKRSKMTKKQYQIMINKYKNQL